jgi:hypothetical protein
MKAQQPIRDTDNVSQAGLPFMPQLTKLVLNGYVSAADGGSHASLRDIESSKQVAVHAGA